MTELDHTMGCERFAELLPALLERELDEATRAAAEGHAVRCRDCGPLLADLRRLRVDAANLRPVSPSRDLWAGIEARIQPQVFAIGSTTGEGGARRVERRISVRAASIAAAVLVVATAGITYEVGRRNAIGNAERVAAQQPPRTDTSFGGSPTEQTVIVPVASDITSSSYSAEIGRLRRILDARRAKLNPATVSVVERNLRAIDDAIAQVKEALKQDPASAVLLESLNNAYETKIDLLRTVTTLETDTP